MISKDFSRVESVEEALKRTSLYIIDLARTIRVDTNIKIVLDGKLYVFFGLDSVKEYVLKKKGYDISMKNNYQVEALIIDYLTEILLKHKEKQDREYEYKIELKQRRKSYDRSYADKNNCLYFLTNKRKKSSAESQIVYEEKTVDKTETVKTKKFIVNNSYNDFIDL